MILVYFTRRALATVNRAARVILTMYCLTAINRLVKRKVLTMDEYELELCPFCGGKAQVRYTGCGSGSHGYTSNILMRSKAGFVICLKCGCRTPIHSKVCRAINKWNRRADNG